jgi:hypothetical protein
MRPLLLALLLLLPACVPVIVVAPPTATPLPLQNAERLYRALYFQAITSDILREAAVAFEAGEIGAEETLGMMLLTGGTLRASFDALDRVYPDIFAEQHALAKKQHNALRDIGTRWMQERTLATADLPAALDALDANAVLLRYTDWLLVHGVSHDEIEGMGLRVRADIAKALGTPTP